MKLAYNDSSRANRWIAAGIIVLLMGVALNLYAVSGFPFAPAMDWYINFFLGAVMAVIGVGMIDHGWHEHRRARAA